MPRCPRCGNEFETGDSCPDCGVPQAHDASWPWHWQLVTVALTAQVASLALPVSDALRSAALEAAAFGAVAFAFGFVAGHRWKALRVFQGWACLYVLWSAFGYVCACAPDVNNSFTIGALLTVIEAALGALAMIGGSLLRVQPHWRYVLAVPIASAGTLAIWHLSRVLSL